VIESLRRDVEALCEPGEREVGSRGHRAARAWLAQRMADAGLEPCSGDSFEMPCEQARGWLTSLRGALGREPHGAEGASPEGSARIVNLVGRLPGRDPAAAPVLLAAHYDTCGPQPGADDNAAAIAILLALVQPLRARALERAVLFAFFDAEEPPHWLTRTMGSIWYYERQREEEIHCALVLDLVGHDVPLPGLEDLIFLTGIESDPGLAGVLRECESAVDQRFVPTLNRYVGDLSDHHVFRVRRRPYLFLSCGHWEHYHAPTDTPDRLNYEKMASIVRFLEELTARASAARLEGPFEKHDTTATELHYVRKHLGPLAAALEIKLEGRRGIEELVDAMLASGL
jgi:hypothetical protein